MQQSIVPIARLGTVVMTLVAGAAMPALGQTGRFDLEKTKTVLSGLIETALVEGGVPSISIALVKGTDIVWTAAFGHANVRTKTPATPATIYSTGSTFKSATATALMQLVEKGKVQLDHPVNRYLGDARVQDRLQVDKPVTFVHILSHWSGLTAGAETKPIWGRELPKPLETMVSRLYSVRAPEEKYEYNNFAYGMAGLLVEKISGVEYEKYMVENVLRPIGVETPHPVRPSPEMVELMALPYMAGGGRGKAQAVAQVHYDVYPAGDIYLTAEDMARFLGAHLNGGVFNGNRILSEASLKEMHQPRFGGNYALGLSVAKDDAGHRIISHSGGIPGQSSFMMGDLDARVGVYYMSNSGAPPSIAQVAIGLLRGEDYTPPTKPKTIAVDPRTLDSYAGIYQLANGMTVTIAREDDGLVFQLGENSMAKEALGALSPTRFRFRLMGNDALVRFAKDDSGTVNQLVVEVADQELPGKKRR